MTTKKATLTELKKSLRQKTQNELVEEVAHLYKKFDNVKEFYQASFFNNDSAVLDKYKKIVKNAYAFSDDRPYPKLKPGVARKAISDYKKVSCSNTGIADIMLTFVETGIECITQHGDLDMPCYNSIVKMYESTLKYIMKEGLLDRFNNRIKSLLANSLNCGWGYHEVLFEMLEEYTKLPDTNYI